MTKEYTLEELQKLGAKPKIQPTKKEYGLIEAGLTGLTNIPSSGKKFVSDIYSVVRHPIKTLEGIGSIGSGIMEKTIGSGIKKIMGVTPEQEASATGVSSGFLKGGQKSSAATSEVMKFYSDRYGGWDNVKRTMAEDPVGFLADVSSVFTGGGGALTKLGAVSKTAGMAKTGSLLEKAGQVSSAVGRTSDPISLTAKTIGGTKNLAGRALSEAIGAGTGTGYGAVKEAYSAKPTFLKTFTNKEPISSFLDDAVNNLGTIKTNRRNAYKADLVKISKEQPVSPDKLQEILEPINQSLGDNMKRFRVNPKMVEVTDNGKIKLLDSAFEESSIRNDAYSVNSIKTIFEDVKNWKDFSINGLDDLKQGIDNLYSPNNLARAFVQDMKNSIRTIAEKDPVYKKMTSEYNNVSKKINEITKTLSLGDKTSIDTGIKKLSSTLRQNNEYRQLLVKELEELGGKEFTSKIAGAAMNEWMPRGLMKIVAGNAVLNSAAILKVIVLLPFTSPKIMGGLLFALGTSANKVNQVVGLLRKAKIKAGGNTAKYFEELGMSPEAAQSFGNYISTGTMSDKLKYLYELSNITGAPATKE